MAINFFTIFFTVTMMQTHGTDGQANFFASNISAVLSSAYSFKTADRNFFVEADGRVEDHHEAGEETSTTLNELLSRLSDSGYDARFRPHLRGRPVYISCSVYIGSISSLSESNMDITVDFYFRQSWDDYRLQWNSSDDEAVNIAGDNINFIWMPDTTFPNVKQASFHFVTRQNAFVRITPSGHVRMSTRIKLTASCPMDLRDFPMDTQCCALLIQSFSQPVKDIVYGWLQELTSAEYQASAHYKEENETMAEVPVSISHHAVGFDGEVTKFTSYVITGFKVEESVVLTHDGYNHSRLTIHMYFSRNIGYYLIQVYLPAGLMVASSWVSFWLPRHSEPARVTLGVTTILVCVTLSGQQYIAMPKISYLKAIDIYLLTCFATVFLTFFEFAVVSYIIQRARQRFALHNKQINSRSDVNNEKRHYYYYKRRRTSAHDDFAADVHCKFMVQELTPELPHHETHVTIGQTQLNFGTAKTNITAVPSINGWLTALPSRIEKVSRILFPLAFFIFNAVYWTYFYMIHENHDEIEGFVKL